MMANENFCAFLRGVNVGGINMKMADVCDVFANAGVNNVKAVLASGNIIFSSKVNIVLLKHLLEKALLQHFNYDAHIFIKNNAEIKNMLIDNPFKKSENYHVYAFIGEEGIDALLMQIFNHSNVEAGEEAKIVNRNFYWQIQKGNTLHSSFGKVLGRKDLRENFTSRNINTIEKIINKF